MSTCPKCQYPGQRTKWKPPEGLDPFLVEYECPQCHTKFYVPQGVMKEKQGGKRKSFNR